MAGVKLGLLAADVFQHIAGLESAHVNLLQTVFKQLMILVDGSAIENMNKMQRALYLRLVVIWLIKVHIILWSSV